MPPFFDPEDVRAISYRKPPRCSGDDTLSYDNGAPPSRPTPQKNPGLVSVCGSQAYSTSAPAPAHTLPGSLSPARDLLLLFAACHY